MVGLGREIDTQGSGVCGIVPSVLADIGTPYLPKPITQRERSMELETGPHGRQLRTTYYMHDGQNLCNNLSISEVVFLLIKVIDLATTHS